MKVMQYFVDMIPRDPNKEYPHISDFYEQLQKLSLEKKMTRCCSGFHQILNSIIGVREVNLSEEMLRFCSDLYSNVHCRSYSEGGIVVYIIICQPLSQNIISLFNTIPFNFQSIRFRFFSLVLALIARSPSFEWDWIDVFISMGDQCPFKTMYGVASQNPGIYMFRVEKVINITHDRMVKQTDEIAKRNVGKVLSFWEHITGIDTLRSTFAARYPDLASYIE